MPRTNRLYSNIFAPETYFPDFDSTGTDPDNKITNERHVLSDETGLDFHVIIPLFGPFFETNFILAYKQNSNSTPVVLQHHIDYNFCYTYLGATRGCAKNVHGGIILNNNHLSGEFILTYQTIGGEWVISVPLIDEILANQIQNPKITSWEQIAGVANRFPVIDHEFELTDIIGASYLVQAIEDIGQAITDKQLPDNAPEILDAHVRDITNPHQTTKAQVGLGNVENYGVASDVDAVNSSNNTKYMTPAKTALLITQHEAKNDPHPQYVTQEELGAVQSDTGFRGAYLGEVSLIANKYTINSNTFSVSNGIFSIKFLTDNTTGVLLNLNGIEKLITNYDGQPIEAGEILANQTRVLINNPSNFTLVDVTKYVAIPFLSNMFTNVNQNEVVRFTPSALAKAISDRINSNVIGFADKDSNKVVYSGVLSGFTGLTAGSVYYLSDTTAGAMTAITPKDEIIKLGIAKSSTELFVSIDKLSSDGAMPTGGNGDKAFFLNDFTINNNYTVPLNKNAMSIGPIEIANEVTIDISNGSTWVIV